MSAVDEVQLLPTRKLGPGQRTEVWVADAHGGASELVYTSDELLLEAPNWAPDGDALLLNGDGLLWRLDLEPEVALDTVSSPTYRRSTTTTSLDAPRGLIYLSANDGHIYVAPIEGGTATRVTHDPSRYHFLHGVSPDGETLAFVDLPRGDFSASRPARPHPDARRRDQLPGGRHPAPRRTRILRRRRVDLPQHRGVRHPPGPRAARPDPGRRWRARAPGRLRHRRLVPAPVAGRATSPPTSASRPAPSATRPTSTSRSEWSRRPTGRAPLQVIPLFGGQGTINVNSWSPDGRRFAYVAYPITAANA